MRAELILAACTASNTICATRRMQVLGAFPAVLDDLNFQFSRGACLPTQGRSQYEANRGTRLGKILPNTVDFYFFYQTDNIRRFHTADFVQRTVCSPRL